MGIIGYNGNLEMFKCDLNIFNIVKVRDDWSCCKCRNKIPMGSYCWGRGYQKFCLNCGYEVSNNFIVEINKFSSLLKEVIKRFEKDKEKYAINNVVGNL